MQKVFRFTLACRDLLMCCSAEDFRGGSILFCNMVSSFSFSKYSHTLNDKILSQYFGKKKKRPRVKDEHLVVL